MNEFATCEHCGEEIVRSLSIPVWGHLGSATFAGSTLCGIGDYRATPAKD